jgi:hypothetical protein
LCARLPCNFRGDFFLTAPDGRRESSAAAFGSCPPLFSAHAQAWIALIADRSLTVIACGSACRLQILFIVHLKMPFNFSGQDFDEHFNQGSLQTGIISMAIAGPSTGPDVCEPETAQPRATSARSSAPACVTACAILCALLAAGCAQQPAQRESKSVERSVKAAPVRAAVRTDRQPEKSFAGLLIRRPEPALLAPHPAPDCEFDGSNVRAVDPNEWARLKIDFERQCYKDAEKTARERLTALQASIEPIRQPRTARRSTQ